ncbi:hypothetical protein CCUG63695_04025 [Mycobacteroides franklinii]|uniref:CAP domain-containing protein n=2 Tax=Mycobacteroides franklinii TaxID=948102 RepID=A0A4R8RCW2_9MYCO|nr:hypothetical protein CCUG64054_04098 [Mycobacteroides franklinii]TDZ51167.1 hypothetical protein CCUG63697_02683 [Mycobacteroides franklinii]TDZ57587.1 hypothetical protein CCUG63696_04094 [Mycobacteroides franklinii]TDZ64529.1 hypothetical protein CCUG63695_04025 [Mycobacteroides franklinii]TDZ70926.1 hypothetical protein CCUG64056_04098 [Mycobacteroides franklinii]
MLMAGLPSVRCLRAMRAVTGVAVALPLVSVLFAPPAVADRALVVEQAVSSARSAAQCGPLRYNPTVERAADIVNRSTYAFLNHTAENVPADEPHPTAIAKDLGIAGSKVTSLQGAGHNEADALKGVLLEGRDDIPDCSYTEFGSSLLYEEQSGFTLIVVVLAGA